ncbi:alternative NAD(P)H-ubiquinone oxidoreductase C1, chloroplastic/mitochondrial-like [Olea europaea var. sylvestris]|uniref:demethylphylloquinone reductase n=1 Tax=Olea europaea subsp. europaea TaxID=158383 RepID=A0A8S0UAG8_OLEEU|nr:alternative NAD(P)H-ubiquinone oxidoreductase C1, chloroplastic/mitochondrial-like [Olea europaea var. sylvestris]CAA3016013.1 alternative NAD(P)H-ubiquinone oxidoreductase C1, chloroplastic mitochondrial [Olea europaea subsp. europaea]
MAHTISPSAATLAYLHRRKFTRGKLFPGRSCKNSSGSLLPSARRRFYFVASATNERYRGVMEISESEARPPIYAWPDHNKRPRICILGGGFGGLYTALRLESLVWPDDKKPQVVLVDQSEHFVFKPLLYELLSGEVDEWEIAPRFSDLLGNTSVQFFRDRVKCLYPSDHLGMNGATVTGSGGVVHLESGLLIEYDWLVLALGAEAKLDLVPGAVEYALPFSTLEDAHKVNEKLRALERTYFGKDYPIRVAVVGCGYSGVELAATISERLQDGGVVKAINVGKEILPNAPPGNRESALKVLSSRNVQLLPGYVVRRIRKGGGFGTSHELTKVEALYDATEIRTPESLVLELQPAERGLQSQIVEVDLVLWTVGTKPQLPLLEHNDNPNMLPLNVRGQVETDETLRVKGHPRVFAVGDSCALRGKHGNLLPATAQVALQQADFVGWNLWAAINGRPLLPFRFQNVGEMMTLGRYDGAVSPSFLEGITLEGPIGHSVRKFACLTRFPTDEHRLKVGFSWLTKSAVETAAFVQNTFTKYLQNLR